mmetsp:Transcript_31284/g.82108  ORF Transcript_31284/g.82108 Transcript_31284/m.82108 type:complete len:99 (+) Transcript_31284:73-369(+)
MWALWSSLAVGVALAAIAFVALGGTGRGRLPKKSTIVGMSRNSTEEPSPFERDTTQSVAAKLEAGEGASPQQQAKLGLDFWKMPDRQLSTVSTASVAR